MEYRRREMSKQKFHINDWAEVIHGRFKGIVGRVSYCESIPSCDYGPLGKRIYYSLIDCNQKLSATSDISLTELVNKLVLDGTLKFISSELIFYNRIKDENDAQIKNLSDKDKQGIVQNTSSSRKM